MVRVAGGAITQALIDTQQDAIRTPYIKIYINATDYSSRLLYLEHHEEAYRERAIIGLSNRDGTLDAVNLLGKVFNIGYGYDSSGHGGAATDKVDTAPLWVKSYQIITVMGERIYQIYAEGAWMRLREQKVITNVTGPQAGDATHDPYGKTFAGTHTIYELLELIIEGALSWDLVATPPDDGIIDTLHPTFEVNQLPYENAAALMYRLMWMTKCYLRLEAKSGAITTPSFRVIYPQDADAAVVTYQSDKDDCTGDEITFTEYVEKPTLLIPNSIVVLANRDADGGWDAMAVGEAEDATSIAAYAEIIQVYIDGSLPDEAAADLRAQAILTRLEGETLAGRLVLPHDARLELYDKPDIVDNRTGTTRTWPGNEIVRITNIIHRYDRDKEIYEIECALGEVSADFGVPEFTGPAQPSSPIEPPKPVPEIDPFFGSVIPPDVTEVSPAPVIPGRVPPRPGFGPIESGPVVSGPPADEWYTPVQGLKPAMQKLFDAARAQRMAKAKQIISPVSGRVTMGQPAPKPTTPSLWSYLTPWKEEKGETFGGEMQKLWNKIFGGK